VYERGEHQSGPILWFRTATGGSGRRGIRSDRNEQRRDFAPSFQHRPDICC